MEYKHAFAAILLLSLVQIFGMSYAQTDALSLTNVAVYPQPIVAGGNATIQFSLYNSYVSSLTNVNLQLTGTYPILNYSPSSSYIISTINTGSYNGATPFDYKLHIPKNINAGTYTLDVYASYQTVGPTGEEVSATSTMPLSFYVKGTPNLRFTANPSSAISPGSQSTVSIAVLNVGTDNATNVSISVLNSRNFSAVGAANFSLGTISPQKTATAQAILLANSTVGQGSSSFPILVSYNTGYNTNTVTYMQNVPVTVSLGNPDLVVGITSATPASLYAGTNQTLTFSVQNTGSGAAKNVTLSLVSNPNITAGNSASKIYVGSIAAGSSATATMFITANKNDNKQKYSLPIQLTYQNANYNVTTNKTVQVPITLQSIAQFNVTSISGTLAAGATYVPVTVTVKNMGNAAAQSITFTMQTIYPISQVNPNAYLSSLQPGQTANVTFDVNVDSQASPGQYPITLYEQWTQSTGTTNQQYSASQNYYAEVTGGSGGITLIIEIIIAVIVIAVLYIRVIKPRMAKATEPKKQKK